jgi:ribosomal-protein-alanine N-acetyltransferase
MRYGDDDAHLDLLAVAPPYRRAGVGRRLVEWLEQCALVAGIYTVDLEVRAGNEEARLFYHRIGYHHLAELPGYYQGVEAAIRMRRNLSDRPVIPAIPERPLYLSRNFQHNLPSVRRTW